MTTQPALHRTLARQLARLGLDPGTPPGGQAWGRLLATVSTTYTEADDERYTLERSIDISSQEMRSLHEVLRRQALQDPLTGLPNRAAVLAHLDRALVARDRGDLMVLFIDLDGFKQVNDTLGHAAGDELLVRAGQRIRACLRPEDVVGRLGGDEFVVVVVTTPGTPVDALAGGVAARISAQLAAPFRMGDQDVSVSASIGTATAGASACDQGAATGEQLLHQADVAMYAVKTAAKARAAAIDTSVGSADTLRQRN